jgi:hypothetical protein
MNYALITRRVVFGVTVAILLFDLWVAAFGGSGATISLQGFYLTGSSFRGKSLLFAIGYLCGHIFGRIDS